MSDKMPTPPPKILLLHGNRQTGQLLLSRVKNLQRKLQKTFNLQLIAPDAPFPSPDNTQMNTWWNRIGSGSSCTYQGLEESLSFVHKLWKSDNFVGILGFSQGARLAHLITIRHAVLGEFEQLQFVIFVGGYEKPHPVDFSLELNETIHVPSLHIMGKGDKIIPVEESRELLKLYNDPIVYEHDGGHFVPNKGSDMKVYFDFLHSHFQKREEIVVEKQNSRLDEGKSSESRATTKMNTIPPPDEEHAQTQLEEIEALQLIYPDEFQLVSSPNTHPIRFSVKIPPDDNSDPSLYPPKPISLQVEYPPQYPDVKPVLYLQHDMTSSEFRSAHACIQQLQQTTEEEAGMPCIMSCILSLHQFFQNGGLIQEHQQQQQQLEEESYDDDKKHHLLLSPVSPEQIQICNTEGITIAQSLLQQLNPTKGGVWKYTIGLVGKPSAGKSTFFNAATAFARQKNGDGASMAPHPFTTIDPNIGYCFVPIPDDDDDGEEDGSSSSASLYGRDEKGRRMIPVLLKDVAGLVPGAYQGRGKGNKFLNDLTDADVLIHVVDASGTADEEGNDMGEEGGGVHPLKDLAWVRNELLEWIYSNIEAKWENITRRGRDKLVDMFSGYRQPQSLILDILLSMERFFEHHHHHENKSFETWDQGDLHRLISAFLEIRFPMAIALNKHDLPSANNFAQDVMDALPAHGARVGVPLSARDEMEFVRTRIFSSKQKKGVAPYGVWFCLRSAITLREPILVFPVSDMTTYYPLRGFNKIATSDASLPSPKMIQCLKDAGGTSPTCWDEEKQMYVEKEDTLRDVLVMKPGSTVEDVFVVLKYLGVLAGEFVRAEGVGKMGEKAKLVPKHELITKKNRILKIMTTKRKEWQK